MSLLPHPSLTHFLSHTHAPITQLSDVDGLANFTCLGYVILPGNNLTLEALKKLQEVQIMSAMLFGNPVEADQACKFNPDTSNSNPREGSSTFD